MLSSGAQQKTEWPNNYYLFDYHMINRCPNVWAICAKKLTDDWLLGEFMVTIAIINKKQVKTTIEDLDSDKSIQDITL